MKIHYLSYPLDLSDSFTPSSVSIGYFDGVHLGHQKVINTGLKKAKNKKNASAVMTFHPHPREVLGKSGYTQFLTPLEDKLAIFENMGIDIAYVVQFNLAVSKVSPEDFIEQFLVPLNIKHIIVGFDYKFGIEGKGTPEYLLQRSKGRYEVDIISPIKQYNQKVGSTLIRNLVKQGNISIVNELLGRPYTIKGKIIEFKKHNQDKQSAVAKICVHKPYLLPEKGIYCIQISNGGEYYKGLLTVQSMEFSRGDTIELLLNVDNVHHLAFKGINVDIEMIASLQQQKTYFENTFQKINKTVIGS